MFLGYLPKKEGKRKGLLLDIKKLRESFKSTVIFYESPFRLLKSLEDIKHVFGEVDVVICRELTKMHEEIRREKVTESIGYFSKTTPKGEITILL